MLEVHNLSAAYGQSEVLHAIDLSAHGRRDRRARRTQRHGQVDSDEVADRGHAGAFRADHGRRRRRHRAAELPAGRARPRLRAAGPADFRHHDGQGKHRDRSRRHRQERNPGRDLQPVSDTGRFRQTARRQSVRRSAAAIGHRARARQRSQGAAARRADRRHPALDHQGYGAPAA